MVDPVRGPRVAVSALEGFCAEALSSIGVPREDAITVATVMVRNEMRGISHGVGILDGYAAHILEGGMNPAPEIAVVRDSGATVLLDGNAGLGPLIACRAMSLAIERAEQHGIALVTARDGNNFAAAGYYAKMAADAGLVGLAMTNADPTMPVAGAAGRVVGNNPFACAVPGPSGEAVYLDIAMSAVAGTKLAIASREGVRVSEGWVTDEQGRPTTDPAVFAAGGALAPMAGYKGSGLALMVEALTGVLAGAAIMAEMNDWKQQPALRSNQAHTCIAIAIDSLMPVAEFQDGMARLAEQVAAAHPAPSTERLYLPGQIEHGRERDAVENGVPLRPASVEGLRNLAKATGQQSQLAALLKGHVDA